MISCIIIDDENKARLLLRNMIQDIDTSISIVSECDDLPSGVKAIKKYKPNLVILDIEMPGHSGLEILDYFEDDEITFKIIFCTGYSEYAIQAFQLSAIDYLLKPINTNSLENALHRFHKSDISNQIAEYRALQENISKNNDIQDKCIVVNLTSSTRFVKIKDIVLLQAEGSYCILFLQDGEKIIASKNLKHFEEKLSDIPMFFRAHKSYIVNLRKVKEYKKSENSLLMQDKNIAMISVDKADLFIQKMEQLL